VQVRLRTLFLLTLIAAVGCLLIRNGRDVYVWALSKVPAIRLIAPQWATSAWESRFEEARSRSEAEAMSLLVAMLQGAPMEQAFALENLQSFPPQVVAHHAAEFVDILEDCRYPSLCVAAAEQLVRVGPLARSEVPRLLEIPKRSEHDWQKFQVEYVLTAIGDFRPEVVRVINDIRSERVYQHFHPNTDLHPNTGLHYIDTARFSDRHRMDASVGPVD
jgi:hypothetical protein